MIAVDVLRLIEISVGHGSGSFLKILDRLSAMNGFWLRICCLLLLSSSAIAAEAGAEGAGHHEPYSFKADLPFWSLVVFVLFVLAIKKLGWKGFVDGLARREQKELETLSAADKVQSDAKSLLREHRGKIEALSETVRSTLEEADRDARQTRDHIAAAARSDAEGIKSRAINEIKRTQDQTLNSIFEELTNLVSQNTESRLRSGLSRNDHDELIAKALKDVVGS